MGPFDPRLTIIAQEARVRTPHVYHCIHALKEMGKQFSVPAFCLFTGLEACHVERILAALEAHDAMPTKRSSSGVRGTRLPDDWTLPEEWRDWAIKERRWSPSETTEEGEIFANYWQAKSGAQATKLDWRKTWQNWVRNSRRPTGDYRPNSERQTPEQWVAFCEEKVRWCKEHDYRDGIRDWSEKLEQARMKAMPGNVLPFGKTGTTS